MLDKFNELEERVIDLINLLWLFYMCAVNGWPPRWNKGGDPINEKQFPMPGTGYTQIIELPNGAVIERKMRS